RSVNRETGRRTRRRLDGCAPSHSDALHRRTIIRGTAIAAFASMAKRKTLRRLGAAAVFVGTAGSALRWLRKVGARRRRVDMRMTVVVERPVPDVFEFCRDFENLARIIDIPLEIEDFQDGRSHWRVPSRAGLPTEWEANISKYVPNSVIAWESNPGSPVKASG